ncbi:MAG: 50S ribosomal protein L22 [Fervidicoccaceae archaeon]|jgi:large subunit ribosomal protein L22|nr:50S ribosomal protein L22 [Fervidicoccaceae archaeon]
MVKAWRYSFQVEKPESVARAVIRDIPVSYKKLVNIARAIKGMTLEEAKRYLEGVIKGEEPVPHWTYRKKIPHHAKTAERWGVPQARYPRKAAKYLLKLIQNLEANAEGKGLDAEKLRIIHVGVHKSYTLRRYMPRAFGRATRKFKRFSNVEAIAAER